MVSPSIAWIEYDDKYCLTWECYKEECKLFTVDPPEEPQKTNNKCESSHTAHTCKHVDYYGNVEKWHELEKFKKKNYGDLSIIKTEIKDDKNREEIEELYFETAKKVIKKSVCTYRLNRHSINFLAPIDGNYIFVATKREPQNNKAQNEREIGIKTLSVKTAFSPNNKGKNHITKGFIHILNDISKNKARGYVLIKKPDNFQNKELEEIFKEILLGNDRKSSFENYIYKRQDLDLNLLQFTDKENPEMELSVECKAAILYHSYNTLSTHNTKHLSKMSEETLENLLVALTMTSPLIAGGEELISYYLNIPYGEYYPRLKSNYKIPMDGGSYSNLIAEEVYGTIEHASRKLYAGDHSLDKLVKIMKSLHDKQVQAAQEIVDLIDDEMEDVADIYIFSHLIYEKSMSELVRIIKKQIGQDKETRIDLVKKMEEYKIASLRAYNPKIKERFGENYQEVWLPVAQSIFGEDYLSKLESPSSLEGN